MVDHLLVDEKLLIQKINAKFKGLLHLLIFLIILYYVKNYMYLKEKISLIFIFNLSFKDMIFNIYN